MSSRWRWCRVAVGVVLVAPSSLAQQPSGTPAATQPAATQPVATSGSCVETAEASTRPRVKESFPARGLSGHAVSLKVEVTHGKGQSVLPSGFRLQREGPAVEALKQAGFVLPDPEGPAAPKLESKPKGEEVITLVEFPFLILPEEPGRQTLTLPSVPIALTRASGELVTLCTGTHSISIEDPTANTPNPKPKNNPEPRRQQEEWTALKYAVFGLLAALVLAALTALLVRQWLRRPRRAAPAVKARPPWDVAREKLFDLRHAGLIAQGRTEEHYERATNIIRQYLGDRFGFDGLDCTTRETVHLIRNGGVDHATGLVIRNCLLDADLVKFAKVLPTPEQCEQVLKEADEIIQKTLPVASPATPLLNTGGPSAEEGRSP